jgi:uncharacterized protein
VKHNDTTSPETIIESFISFISNAHFACVAARAASARKQIRCMVGNNMAADKNDREILQFIYRFVDDYRNSHELFHSVAILFTAPEIIDEAHFDDLLWKRLQALSDLDAERHDYDTRVNSNPSSPRFSFSLKSEAFFVIGLHPESSRLMRRFAYPAIVFNPHQQFEMLRRHQHYESMKKTVRQIDFKLSGSINPMLDDYGSSSEAKQYSGRQYSNDWICPLRVKHANAKSNTAP